MYSLLSDFFKKSTCIAPGGLRGLCAAALLTLMICSCGSEGQQSVTAGSSDSPYAAFQDAAVLAGSAHKPVIYQLFVRLFGNRTLLNQYYGSVEQNGVGKFNDITDRALDSIRQLGVTHIWYTGVLEHATMTDYSGFGIAADDPDVVKGRAGSPYAVKDYYDVDPDLAVDVNQRLAEFDSLVARTHRHGLKVVMDFIPNHVARQYHSDRSPDGVTDFGAGDNKKLRFSPQNDFYYLPGTAFKVPQGVEAGGVDFKGALKDGRFKESPAKVTGNNVLRPDPSIGDWYETVKLNYGVDIFNSDQTHFEPRPPMWDKMRDILAYWAARGVDGFRCDVAEMVPLEFWEYVTKEIKEQYPGVIFIAEAYNPDSYRDFVETGGFDYLYNKVGLYDALKPLVRGDSSADIQDVVAVLERQQAYSSHMLNFLENHDEERIASEAFAGDPFWGTAAMGLAATLTDGPLLLYFGQELGVAANEAEGFGAADGKTTIFDYWGLPRYQDWVNGGQFDGGKLTDAARQLRSFYRRLLHLIARYPVISNGRLSVLSGTDTGRYSICYLRFNLDQTLFFAANFDRQSVMDVRLHLPDTLQLGAASGLRPLLSSTGRDRFTLDGNMVEVELPPGGFLVWRIR